jgi:biotin synthase
LKGLTKTEAIAAIECDTKEVLGILLRANEKRMENRGLKVTLCGVVNAKSGMCTEDCKFCAQSEHNDSVIDRYPLISEHKVIESARAAESAHAKRFGIVTSGVAVEDEHEIRTIEKAVKDIAGGLKISPCASLGNISRDTLARLKQAGLTRYHCNLETAQSFFPKICTTHDWSDAADTICLAKETGLDTCCGGIFGIGESPAERVELLEAIRNLDVDSVPLNFFHLVPGIRLDHAEPLKPLECLKIIAVARLMMPDKEIRVCGGREHNLRDLQSWALISGADGLMVGGYLTTAGRNVDDDLKMIADAGFHVDSV